MFTKKVGKTIELRIWEGGPFVAHQYGPNYIKALTQLAKEAFPQDSPEEVVNNDFLGHEWHTSLWTGDCLIGAASRQIREIPWNGINIKLLYFCTAAIFKKWQGQGMSYHFYGPIFDQIQPDLVATTTKVAAIYFQMLKLSQDMGLILSHSRDGKIQPSFFKLGKGVLKETGRNPEQLDNTLVRRNYLPESTSEVSRFELFGILNVKPEDGVLLLATRLKIK